VAELVQQLIEQLAQLAPGRFTVRGHSPYAASDYSQPEPDVVVIPKHVVGDPHPRTCHLVVEVADSSLQKDRRIKTSIYAEAGVPAYWIVDVEGGAVEVHIEPEGDHYRTMTRLGRGDVLRPVELPGVAIAVVEILPPA